MRCCDVEDSFTTHSCFILILGPFDFGFFFVSLSFVHVFVVAVITKGEKKRW